MTLPDGFQFNIGVDLENISRWRELLPQLQSPSNEKLFFPEEHEYCLSFTDAAPHYAGHWCAKEAVVKALTPFCRLTTRDIRIHHDQSGQPVANLVNPQGLSTLVDIKLSISHGADTAIAFAIAVDKSTSVKQVEIPLAQAN